MTGTDRIKVLELVDRLERVRGRILDAGEVAADECFLLRAAMDRDLRDIALEVARLADA
jgi:hypothetical protein